MKLSGGQGVAKPLQLQALGVIMLLLVVVSALSMDTPLRAAEKKKGRKGTFRFAC
jgi:hypothetical protein